MTKTPKDQTDPALRRLDEILGPVEEMSDVEISSTIAAAGIDLAAARRRLYEQVIEKRARLWASNQSVSSDITTLLEQFRPHDRPSSDPAVAEKVAAGWLRDMVDRRIDAGPLEFATAARNLDGQLSENDQQVLRELEEELKAKKPQPE